MPNKTILFLDQYSGLSGGQKVLTQVIDACLKKEYNCIAVLPGNGPLVKKLKQSRCEVTLFPIGYYTITKKNILDSLSYLVRLPLLVFLLIALIKRKHVNLIYANGARTFAWATIACSITNTPLIWHVHSIFDKGIIKKLCQFFGSFKAVKKILTVSKIAARPFSSLDSKVRVIYNAPEKSELISQGDILRAEFNIPRNNFIVAIIAILEEWKNQEDLIQAARRICVNAKNDITFFIIGDSLYPEPNKQAYKNKLKSMTAEFNLLNKVIFTGFRRDITQILSSVDCLVISSKDPDPCPLVGLEAAGADCAIISTEPGGMSEIFIKDKEALFYKAGDFNSLTERITRLFNSRTLAKNLGNAAKEKIQKNYNIDIFLGTITREIANNIHAK